MHMSKFAKKFLNLSEKKRFINDSFSENGKPSKTGFFTVIVVLH